ncbi:MAG: hypothetical protein SGI77_03885 [Pirellulaceae bacterium]|nr:hypothetical protein [Pirellulaceae bacterium]
MSNSQLNIERRIDISLAVGRYVRAVDRFATASQELTDACSSLRNQLPEPLRFVTQFDYRHYLVVSDDCGNFDVEQIEVI